MIWLLQFLFSPLPTPALIGLITLGVMMFLWVANRPKPIMPPVDLNKQSIGIEGAARRSAILPDNKLLCYIYEDAKTLYEAFQRGLHASGNGPCLGYRKPKQPYQWLTYKQVSERAEYLGSGLLQKGCKSSPDQFVGIFAQNRPEVSTGEQPYYPVVLLALKDLQIGTNLKYWVVWVSSAADLTTVICDKSERAQVLLDNCEQGKTPGLKTIILMDLFDNELKERGAKMGVEILLQQEVEPPKPEDLCIICFTSGTTGTFFAFKLAALTASIEKGAGGGGECPCRFLNTLAFLHTVLYTSGAKVGFFQGDIKLLTDDMKALKPTLFPVVPRLLNRVYDKIQSGARGSLKKLLLAAAVAAKTAELKQGIIRNNSIWDKLIFKKVQETMGGQVRLVVTGAAPISPTVMIFLRAALGCQIFEAYGQTECAAGSTVSNPGDWTTGHVGAPLACNIIKLEDVEEMNYYSANNEGEVCIKGPNVFRGYLKDPEKTAEALDKDGWLHTGDIGKWMPNGTLKIIDRKKNIFKLAQGEYVAPERIENIYIRSSPVSQVFVHGESLRVSLGIVIPDPETLEGFARKLGIKGSYEEICKNLEVKNAILEDMVKLGKEAGLKSFEQVKDIYIHPEALTIENGFLTPTLKAKRAELTKYFKPQIEDLYANIKE
uniref:long-chain-fatty-acid--CoA ligase n=1 Tax=Crocodylus porosus TaxID=8502 RepID=A0A7M4EXY3_CROPO